MSETQPTQTVSQVSPGASQSKADALATSSLDGAQKPASSANVASSKWLGKPVLGPFMIRDLVILTSVLIIFVGTLIPLTRRGVGNFWSTSSLFYLGIGILLPLTVLVLWLLRGLKVIAKVRIGSLSLEQFSSVVASFAAAYFFLLTVASIGAGFLLGYLIALIGSLGLLMGTVLAAWIPFLAVRPATEQNVEAPVDLVGSTFAEPQPAAHSSTESHGSIGSHGKLPETDEPIASASLAGIADVTMVSPSDLAQQTTAPETSLNPLAPRKSSEPESSEPESSGLAAGAAGEESALHASNVNNVALHQEPSSSAGSEPEPVAETRRPESFAATVDPADRPHQNSAGEVTQEAFWFAVDKPKAVVDEHTGGFLYNIEPGSWFLALQDRGYDYLVQNAEGKLGVLRDLRNIERAPQDD